MASAWAGSPLRDFTRIWALYGVFSDGGGVDGAFVKGYYIA